MPARRANLRPPHGAHSDPPRSEILEAAAHNIEMLPDTVQKRQTYVVAEDGKVGAQQCLASTRLTVEFTSAATARGLHQSGLPPGSDEPVADTYGLGNSFCDNLRSSAG